MRALPRLTAVLTAPLLLLPALPASAAELSADLPVPVPVLVPGDRVVLRGSDVAAPSLVPARSHPALRASATGASAATSSNFEVTYTGFSTAQRDAFQAAVDTWERLLASPVTIRIDARLSTLPQGVLGAAGPTNFVVEDEDGRYGPEDTLLPIALGNALAARDFDPEGPDISAEFSNDSSLFSYGTTPSADRYDFTTVVLHEIGHGLGFAGAMDVQTGADGVERGFWNPGTTEPRPLVYDRQAVRPNDDGTVTPLLSLPRGSTELAQALTDGRSVWDGPAGRAANGGKRPELFTPPEWQEGSSYSHLDEQTYPTGDPDSLMTPTIDLGEVVRDPGSIALGMLADIGWSSDLASLRLSGPTSVAAGTRVAVSGAAPRGTVVRIYFKRRGSTETSPGAQPGFTLQRELPVGEDGTFVTSYLANDDHRYYAQVGDQFSEPVLTQVRPTFTGPLTRVVRRGSSVTIGGRGLPSTRLDLRFTRGTAVNVVRSVTVRSDGTWSRSQVLTGDLRVSARGANGESSDTRLLLQAR